MVQKAKEKGLRVILDIKGNDLIDSLKFEPDIIKPNLFEFAATFAPELIKDNDHLIKDKKANEQRIKSIMIDIAKKYKCQIILTNGKEKILAADGSDIFEIDPLSSVNESKTVNSTGSGDAFTAGFAASLEDGATFNEAIKEGIRCGALNAGFIRPGVIFN
jgi:fructose-1-phosphate kinase PfkB-like protein